MSCLGMKQKPLFENVIVDLEDLGIETKPKKRVAFATEYTLLNQ
jgi:hypothetical protein